MYFKMEDSEVVIGTYENLILGFRVIKDFTSEGNENVYSLDTSFTDDAHRGALRCVSVSGNGVLASSSTDDSVRLHSLRRRKEIGGLFEHKGTVNCITFHEKNFMFTASEDGTICVWKAKNWELLRTLKGHRSHVTSVAIHPTGKLVLSVGTDKSLMTWDLTTGKLAFQRKIKEAAQQIHFSQAGDHYVLVYQRAIEVCAIENTQVVKETDFAWRINAFCHIEADLYAVGGDDRHVFIVNVLTGDKVLTLDMATSEDSEFAGRVRSIKVIRGNEEGSHFVFVAASTGHIKAFSVDVTEDGESSEEIMSYSTGNRITCMDVYPCKDLSQGKENEKVGSTKKVAIDNKTTEEEEDDDVDEAENGEDEEVDDDSDDSLEDDDLQEESEEEEEESEEEVEKPPAKKRKRETSKTSAKAVDKKMSKKQKVKSPDVKKKTKKKMKTKQ